MNTELLKDAVAIIDGIPTSRIRMAEPMPFCTLGRSLQDGTVADPGSWLALHPAFPLQAAGIIDLAFAFDIKLLAAERLFGPATWAERYEVSKYARTDKDIWIGRVLAYIKDSSRVLTLAERLAAFDPDKHGGEILSGFTVK